jgi:hypothetical protein
VLSEHLQACLSPMTLTIAVSNLMAQLSGVIQNPSISSSEVVQVWLYVISPQATSSKIEAVDFYAEIVHS